MYKDQNSKKLTEDWINSIKSKNYAQSTLAKLILKISPDIRQSLKGSSAAAKARELIREFSNTNEVSNKENVVWDDRLLVPKGTIIDTQPEYKGSSRIKDPNYAKYEIGDVISDTNVNITHLSISNVKKTSQEYGINDLNSNLKTYRWEVENPTEDIIKKIGKKPNFKILLGNAIGSMLPIKAGMNDTSSYLLKSPTSNCQLCLINNAASFINNIKANDLIKAFKQISQLAGKKLILMDVRSSWLNSLRNILPVSSFTLEQEYKSTNGSKMAIIIINTSNF